MKKILLTGAALLASAVSLQAQAQRDYISIVGSSTVYPFSTVTAERFGRATDFRTPKVESTGSGGGLKLFCSGVGSNTPDITNSSRQIKSSEIELCAKNGVTDVVELMIGYDGIVLANSVKSPRMEITLKEVYLALAKVVPDPKNPDALIENPYKTWNQINPAFPATAIEVLGPPPTSGTRDAFVELGMEGGCSQFPQISALKKTDEKKFKAVCHGLREDGAFVEAGENDNLIVQKLTASPNAFGIFGFSFLEENHDKVQGSIINGKEPTYDAISEGSYPVSRSMFVYAKKAHVGVIPGLQEFLLEMTSVRAMGEDGYMAEKGMITLSDEMRKDAEEIARTLRVIRAK